MTILNQTEIMVSVIPKKFVTLVIIFVLFSAVCEVIGLGFDWHRKICGITGAILFLACGIISFIGCFTKPSGRYQYECLINDTVPYVEIYEKYDVVEQRGSIWVLEDKEK